MSASARQRDVRSCRRRSTRSAMVPEASPNSKLGRARAAKASPQPAPHHPAAAPARRSWSAPSAVRRLPGRWRARASETRPSGMGRTDGRRSLGRPTDDRSDVPLHSRPHSDRAIQPRSNQNAGERTTSITSWQVSVQVCADVRSPPAPDPDRRSGLGRLDADREAQQTRVLRPGRAGDLLPSARAPSRARRSAGRSATRRHLGWSRT